MRRNMVALVGVLLLLIVGMMPAAAYQEASPESGLADLGLPTLDLTVTGTGFEGIPETLEAGRYLVTVTAAEDAGEFGGSVAFVQPVGVAVDEFLGALSAPPEEAGAAAPVGTPAAGTEGGEEEGMGAPPPFVYDATYAGGTYAPAPGESAEIVLDLEPGEWIAWADDPFSPQEPVVFEVTGEMPADLVEPEASATLSMGEYVIAVSEGELVAGPQVLKIENTGAQPHFLFSAQGPDGMTDAQIGVTLEEEMATGDSGTPPAYSDLNPDEDLSEEGFYSATQSMGTAVWLPVDLSAGSHLIACFFPDMADGMPHAYHGMYTVVEVAE